MSRPLRVLVALLALGMAGAGPIAPPGSAAPPADERPAALKEVGIDQRLGEAVSPDLVFRDEADRPVRLGDYFGRRPVILTLNYYECPMLCTLVLNGLISGLRPLRFEPGRDFELVTVSINPRERGALASAKKAAYLAEYGRPGAAGGWHFLTGDEPEIRKLAEQVGFHYAYDEASGQYAHAAGVMLLTPDGRLSRYFYGVEFAPRDLKLGLVESSEGRIGSLAEQLLLFCYHYDPATGRYNLAAIASMRAGGVLTVILLAAFVAAMLVREIRRRASSAESSPRAL